jgi:hypothetical protein
MSHVRKDTLTRPPEWWKHLRPDNKKLVAKRERKASLKQIGQEIGEGKACGNTTRRIFPNHFSHRGCQSAMGK